MLAKLRNLAAILNNKKLDTYWGFVFDTEHQDFVENFMQRINVSSDEYFLSFADEKPDGVYTFVEVFPEYNEDDSLKDIYFEI